MANEDEVMRFEITDQDLEDEFNIDNRRRPRRSKNSAIYGIWADKSDDESENELTFGKKSKKSDYTAPIGFVSAGFQKKSENEKKDQEALSPTKDSESDDDLDSRPSFNSTNKKKEKYEIRRGEIAGMRSKSYVPNVSLGKGFGDWERHTKGIGAKLLLKMGYQAGKGLGKDLQGRSTIIEAFKRKGKGAVGAYGKEGNRPKKVSSDDDDNLSDEDRTSSKSQWRKGSSKSKIKYVYKSIDQVLDEGKWRKVRDENEDEIKSSSRTKVIDMTGKESRILSGYHAIASSKHVPDEDVEMTTELNKLPSESHFDLPELTHNLNMIVDMCEENIISSDRKLKYHRDRVEVLSIEETKLSELVEKEKEEIDCLESILSAIDEIENKHKDSQLNANESIELFIELKLKLQKDYLRYEIPYIASSMVTPVMRKEMEHWNPLIVSSGKEIRELFKGWRDLLCLNPDARSPDEDPYYTVLWESWMPRVRRAISLWQARVAPDALIHFLNAWINGVDALVPKWMADNILLQHVLPKLQNEVDVWNPLTDTVPIHSWLHPWLPLLSCNLDIVYPTIRNKLGNALSNWDPSDRSAKLILLPWKDVFTKGSMHTFLIKYVLPKLESSMQKLIINPHQQDLNIWNGIMEWRDMFPPSVLVTLMEKHFFPKWLQVLATWLNHHPNYNEVTKWYEGWKSLVPSEILAYQQIKQQLNMGLDMMNRAVGGKDLMGNMRLNMPQQMPTPPPPPVFHPHPLQMSPQIPQGFKDLVSKRCEEKGILFAPLIPSRFKEGKQIYRCGSMNIYLDRNVVFVQQHLKDIWIPTSLNALLENAFH